jgi:PEP-CTERM motif
MRTLTLAMLASVAFAAPVEAATIVRTFDFTGSDIARLFGTDPIPVSDVFLSFTVEFDPLLAYTNQTSGIVLNSVNLPLGSAFGFSYDPLVNQFLTVGGLANNTNGSSTANNDFVLGINNSAGASPTVLSFSFTTAGAPGSLFRSFDNVLSVTAVPEPATWLMMIVGFGAVGASIRRARKRPGLALA